VEDGRKIKVGEGESIRRGVEGGERPKGLSRKAELEKVKVEAVKTEVEREKKRERGKERVPVKVMVGGVDVSIVPKKVNDVKREGINVGKGKGSVVGKEGDREAVVDRKGEEI